MTEFKTCRHPGGCDRPIVAKGWCEAHYRRVRKTGDPGPASIASVPELRTHCPENHEYTPENTYTDAGGKRHCKICRGVARTKSYAAKDWPPCTLPECGRNAYYGLTGWCPSHLRRFRLFGDPLFGDPLFGDPIREAKLSPEEKRRRDLERCRAYHVANRERLNAARSERYHADPAAAMAATRRWVEQNPERWRELMSAANARRRARMNAVAYEFVDREVVLAEHGMVCHICTGRIESRKDLEFDHVIPIARGGSHTYGNVRPSHKTCNRRKGKKLLAELTFTV